jgi:hypothetical protein
MRPLTVGDLQQLIRPRKGSCVSIFLPTHRRPDGATEDRLRFKNLVEEAQRRLEPVESRRVAGRILAPLAAFADSAVWRDRLDGLAVFCADGEVRSWRLPIGLPELVVVSDSFHVRPLLRYLQTNGRYYVLTLSRNALRFHEGTATSLVAKEVPGMPRSLEDAGAAATGRRELSRHAAGAGRTIVGGGSGRQSEREELARCLRAADLAVRAVLRDEHSPLFLAGVTRYHSAYRSVSRYPHLAAEGAEGNFDRARPEEILARVAPLAAAHFRAREDAAVAEHQHVLGAGLATDDLAAIAEAAVLGRVRRLLLAHGRLVKGTLDRTTGAVSRKTDGKDRFADDVLDDLAEAVLVRGGEVISIDTDRMPSRSPVAALLRW